MSDDGSHEFERRAVEAEARLAHAERSLDALRQVSLALGTTLDRDQLLELILSKTAELLSADRATLYLLDEDRGLLVSELMIGDSPQTIELPIGEGIAGWVAKTGKTLRVRDAYRDKRFRREWDDLTGYRTQSILAAPMKNHFGRIIGVVQVINKKDSVEVEFSEHDEDLLVALATQAAVSIDNSRLFVSVIQKNLELVQTKEELERRVSDLKLLFELESAMSRATSLEGFARAIIGEAAKACEASAGGVLVDEGDFLDGPRHLVAPVVIATKRHSLGAQRHGAGRAAEPAAAGPRGLQVVEGGGEGGLDLPAPDEAAGVVLGQQALLLGVEEDAVARRGVVVVGGVGRGLVGEVVDVKVVVVCWLVGWFVRGCG